MFPGKLKSKKLTKRKPIGKAIVILTALVIASIGAYYLFFAKAATNNCQPENGVQICDVDQVGATNDTVLSLNGEAESLGAQGWGTYYGAAFRAPTSAYNGAVPVHRIFNGNNTWHDWVTDTQKNEKQAKYGAANYEGVAFFAWTGPGQPGTVPVYRLARGGAETNVVFSTDRGWVDKMLALDASNPNGWKLDNLAPGIAFYAYPPNYTVAGLTNPYDCSILENFNSERCQKQQENLKTNIDNGNIPKDPGACAKSVNEYINNPLSHLYPKECQDFWNAYMNNCSITENFTSDRCKKEREALAKEQQRQIDARKKADNEIRDTPTTKCKKGYEKRGGKCVAVTPTPGPGPTPPVGDNPGGRCDPGWILKDGECRKAPSGDLPTSPCEKGSVLRNGDCVKTYDGLKCSISWSQDQKWVPWDENKSVTYSTKSSYTETEAISWCKGKKVAWFRKLGSEDGKIAMPGTDCNPILEAKLCKVHYKKTVVYNYAYSWNVN